MNIQEDKVISLIKVNPESHLLTLSENGYGKERYFKFSGQREEAGVIALNTSQRKDGCSSSSS